MRWSYLGKVRGEGEASSCSWRHVLGYAPSALGARQGWERDDPVWVGGRRCPSGWLQWVPGHAAPFRRMKNNSFVLNEEHSWSQSKHGDSREFHSIIPDFSVSQLYSCCYGHRAAGKWGANKTRVMKCQGQQPHNVAGLSALLHPGYKAHIESPALEEWSSLQL